MSERPVVGRITELAAQKPELAIAGAQINRATIGAQQKAIGDRDRLIARINNVTLRAGETAEQKIVRIQELITEWEASNA